MIGRERFEHWRRSSSTQGFKICSISLPPRAVNSGEGNSLHFRLAADGEANSDSMVALISWGWCWRSDP